MTQTADLKVTRASVRRGGRTVAHLTYSGRMITVKMQGKAIGRLLPAGYTEGRPDDGSGLYDVWTAKHPSVPTPSDRQLASSLTVPDAVGFLLTARRVAPLQAFLLNCLQTATPLTEGTPDDPADRHRGH
jgi:hypothetical protein